MFPNVYLICRNFSLTTAAAHEVIDANLRSYCPSYSIFEGEPAHFVKKSYEQIIETARKATAHKDRLKNASVEIASQMRFLMRASDKSKMQAKLVGYSSEIMTGHTWHVQPGAELKSKPEATHNSQEKQISDNTT